jgi:hypothetical protein
MSADSRQTTLAGEEIEPNTTAPPAYARTGLANVAWHAPTWAAGARVVAWYERARAEGVTR